MIAHATPLADWLVILPVLLCLGGATVLLMLRARLQSQSWICGLIILAVIVCDAALLQRIATNGPVSMTMGKWLPPFGISFTADSMGAGFAVTAAFAAFCVVLSMHGTTPEGVIRNGLYPLVLLLLAGVSGAFLTGDLFNLYVWFEVMLIASFGLFIVRGEGLQLEGAIKYGVLNFIATTLFLLGLGLLYGTLGTLNMADIIGAAAKADSALLAAVAALLVLAFGLKAAVFPVNAWLPASYHAPPAVLSALLGGLLTKVGVYAIVRLLVMLLPAARESLAPVIMVVAIVTMLSGPLCALAETNLRRGIGFLLIGGVGVALSGVVEADAAALAGTVAYVVHAILTLTALYLVAGSVEEAAGTSDIRRMGGLYAADSALSAAFLVLILAVAGVPPFLGFWPKLLLLQGFIEKGNWLLPLPLLLNSLLALLAGARWWSLIYWRPSAEPVRSVRLPAAAALLTGTIVVLALWPSLIASLAIRAADKTLDPAAYISSTGLAP